jgi:FkbM family methyltransferase
MKQTMRRLGIKVAGGVGRRLPLSPLRRWMCDRMVPYLMDDTLLPRGLSLRPLRGHSVRVLCDPYIYTHRLPYWCGHLHEMELEQYLHRQLRPGDTFIDIGCNVGQVSMLAAAMVGPGGRVLSFDANPTLAALTSRHAAHQGLSQMSVHDFGLGHEPGRFTLRWDPEHDGGGTLRPLADDRSIDSSLFTSTVDCEVKLGDEVLLPLAMPGRVCVKIDVEGHEPSVLRGMKRVLSERVDHAVLEVTPEWIGGADGVANLFSMMIDAGLQPHELTPSGGIGHTLAPSDVRSQINVVFRRVLPHVSSPRLKHLIHEQVEAPRGSIQ